MSVLRKCVLGTSLAYVLMLPEVSFAQTPSAVSFGIKGGVNSSTVKIADQDEDQWGRRTGAVGGFWVNRGLAGQLGLQIEGLFSVRGARFDHGDNRVETFNLTYFDVPLTVRIGRTTSEGGSLHLFSGPQFGFNLQADETYDDNGDKDKTERKDEVEKVDVGWTIGVAIGKNRISLDARYTIGLTNIPKATAVDAKNRAFAVTLGLRLK